MSVLIELLYARFLSGRGISIDTRTLQAKEMFFAISGMRFNANDFVKQAFEKGATCAVVDDVDLKNDEKIIYVPDTVQALQQLATHHRKQFNLPVLGITGSNGKTTTKELIKRVLSSRWKVCATAGNYNNHLGVPLTLLRIDKNTTFAVIEMGANHLGEISNLCHIALPTHGLITNIGRAHTETFGGIEGVIRGKSELFDYLRQTGGTVFVNQNDKVLKYFGKRFKNPVFFPPESLELIESVPFLAIKSKNKEVATLLSGSYNLENIGAAAAVGQAFTIPEQDILKAIATYRPENARSQIITRKNKVTIILDAYNANPDSMRVALDNLTNQKGNKLAILGDMNELKDSKKCHKEILDYATYKGIETLTVGKKMGEVADPKSYFSTKEAMGKYLKTKKLSGYHILLKASRTMELETLLPFI